MAERSDEQVLGLIQSAFGEEVSRYHDYVGSDLVRAWWLGYQMGVRDSRPEPSAGSQVGDQ